MLNQRATHLNKNEFINPRGFMGSVTQRPGAEENVAYSLTFETARWGDTSTLAVSSVTVKDVTNEQRAVDVSSTVQPAGSEAVASGVVTLKPTTALTIGRVYRHLVKVTLAGSTYTYYFDVYCLSEIDA